MAEWKRRLRSPLTAAVALCLVLALLRAWHAWETAGYPGEEETYRQLVAVAAAPETSLSAAGIGFWPHGLTLRGIGLAVDLVEGERLTPLADAVVRAWQTVWALLAALLLFVVARRLHSTAAALAAIVILGFSPMHVQASVTTLADSQVMCLGVLSLWLAFRVIDAPTAARAAVLGAALGGAAAVKVTGALFALPIVVGLILALRSRPRKLPLVAVTLPVAVAVAWLLLPPIAEVRVALEAEQIAQVGRAAHELGSHLTVAVWGFLIPFRADGHGLVLGFGFLLGALGVGFRYLFLKDPGPHRAEHLLLLGCPLFYLLGYAWATPLFRASGFAPLLPFSAYLAAAFVVDVARVLPLRFGGGDRLAPALGVVIASALAVPAGWHHVYHHKVPSTLAEALAWTRTQLPANAGRSVYVEGRDPGGSMWVRMQTAGGVAVHFTRDLGDAGEAASWADASIYPASRERDGSVHQQWSSAAESRIVIEGEALARRGPDLAVVVRPFAAEHHSYVELDTTEEDWRLRTVLAPASEVGARNGLMIWASPPPGFEPSWPRLWLDGEELELVPSGHAHRGSLFVSERFAVSDVERQVEMLPPRWHRLIAPRGVNVRRGKLAIASFVWLDETERVSDRGASR